MKTVQKGFTLIELMITVAIIGVLVAAAGPVYLDYSIRSQMAEGFRLSGGAKSAVTDYYQNYGKFPADNSEEGIADADRIKGRYVSSVTISDNTITIQYGNDVNVQVFGETIVFTADAEANGSVVWSCGSGGVIQNKHLPTACESQLSLVDTETDLLKPESVP